MESVLARDVVGVAVTPVPPGVAWACELTKVTQWHPGLGWQYFCVSECSALASGSVESAGAVVQMEWKRWWSKSRTLLGSLLDGPTSE